MSHDAWETCEPRGLLQLTAFPVESKIQALIEGLATQAHRPDFSTHIQPSKMSQTLSVSRLNSSVRVEARQVPDQYNPFEISSSDELCNAMRAAKSLSNSTAWKPWNLSTAPPQGQAGPDPRLSNQEPKACRTLALTFRLKVGRRLPVSDLLLGVWRPKEALRGREACLRN